MREKWIEQSAKMGVIEIISQKYNNYLYVTRSKTYDGRSSMYHVWHENSWKYCGTNFTEANEIFYNLCKAGEEDDKQ